MEIFIENLWLLWLIVSFVCLIIELNSGDFYFVCFAAGALLSIIATFIGLPFWAQVLVWAIASVLCLVFVRPSLVRKLHGDKQQRLSNADALIGNGKLRSAEILLQEDGSAKLIRRAETPADYFATFDFGNKTPNCGYALQVGVLLLLFYLYSRISFA